MTFAVSVIASYQFQISSDAQQTSTIVTTIGQGDNKKGKLVSREMFCCLPVEDVVLCMDPEEVDESVCVCV